MAPAKQTPRDGMEPDTYMVLDCGHEALRYNNLRSDPTGWQTWCFECQASRTVTSARERNLRGRPGRVWGAPPDIDPGPIGTVRANQRVTLDDEPARYRCVCKFKTNSRFRWAWHCFWRPIT